MVSKNDFMCDSSSFQVDFTSRNTSRTRPNPSFRRSFSRFSAVFSLKYAVIQDPGGFCTPSGMFKIYFAALMSTYGSLKYRKV